MIDGIGTVIDDFNIDYSRISNILKIADLNFM